MKVSELRKLIREEITKVLFEAKKVEVEIGPFGKDVPNNSKLEPIVKSFIKNVKQRKGVDSTYWLTGTFDENEFAKAKKKYSLDAKSATVRGRINLYYKDIWLLIKPVSMINPVELETLVGITNADTNESDTNRPFSKQVEDALEDHINHFKSYKKLNTLLKSNKIPKKYLTYSGTVYRLVFLKNKKSLQSYLRSPKSIKSTNSFGISCAKSINGINAFVENAMYEDGITVGLIFKTKVKSSDVLLDIDSMFNDLLNYEDEIGIKSGIAYEGEEEVIIKSPMTFSPDMLVATVTDSEIKKIRLK